MTRAVRPRLMIAAFVAPLLILAAGRFAASRVDRAAAQGSKEIEEGLDRDARALQADFAALLRDAVEIARQAGAPSAGTAPDGSLATRLEGTALLDPDGSLARWSGVPTEPSRPLPSAASEPSWSVRVQGLWTRLIAVSPADESGGRGLASFLIDGPEQGERFADLLEHLRAPSALASVEFIDRADSASELAGALGSTSGVSPRTGAPVRFVPLAPAQGNLLAIATLRPVAPGQAAQRARAISAAWAAVLFVALLPWAARWRMLCGSAAGLAGTVMAICAARAALHLARVPLLFFSRELGTSTFYGGTIGWGLFGSPADVLLTALALAAAGWGCLVYCRARLASRPVVARGLALATALAATEVLRRLSVTVAVDARVPLLHSGESSHSAAEIVLLAALAIVLGVAAAAWTLRGARAAAIASFPLAALSALTFLHASDRLAVDRLRSDLAPQIIEQQPRRRLALTASVREAAASDRAAAALSAAPGDTTDFSAYLLWTTGDLFHSGYESSLALYDAEGAQRSQFGFDLPALLESVPVPPVLESVPALPSVEIDPLVREESFREGSITRRLLHAELPVFDDGRPVGTVVGHVLDEPDNLPFLPGLLPYLAALGSGSPGSDAERAEDAPAYVLYAADGSVVLSTLAQPPAPSAAMSAAAASGALLHLRAGDGRFLALPLDDGNRLHLLLLAEPTRLDRIGVFLRLCVLGLAAVAVTAMLRAWRMRAARPAGRPAGSFHRKLLVALLVASVLPVLGLSFFVRSYVERRAQSALVESAARLATVVRRVVEDYAAPDAGDPASAPVMNDEVLHWLRRVVGQEINLYEDGLLTASSKRELFSSGLLPTRLPGEADRRLVREGRPSIVLETRLGSTSIPVAYTRVHLAGPPAREGVVAVPLVLERRELARAVGRVREMLLLATVVLIALLAATASALARTVARPVRELADATRRIAAGDYATRLVPRTRDEVAELVAGFNSMAAALGAQRADLERRRDYIEALLRHATAGVVSTDPAGRVVTLNPAAARLLSDGAPAPATGDELAAAVARNRTLAPLAEALRRAPFGDGDPEDVDLMQDGKPRRLRIVRVALPDPDGGPAGRLLIMDDVTDLVRSNQLAAWAEMARAIAHEIKNPLTPIRLSTEHLERLLRDRGALPAPEIEACIETILQQVASLRQIATEFSAYAKLPDLVLEPTDPAQLMRDAVAPYRASLPAGVELAEHYAAAPFVSVDRRVMARAVVNLIENALHAMAHGGTLSLEVRHAAGEVTLAVADTGPGLDPAARLRLFEPYFSTKSAGTGLGLAIVRRALEAHRGRVEVESEAGRGTEFRLVLPATRAD